MLKEAIRTCGVKAAVYIPLNCPDQCGIMQLWFSTSSGWPFNFKFDRAEPQSCFQGKHMLSSSEVCQSLNIIYRLGFNKMCKSEHSEEYSLKESIHLKPRVPSSGLLFKTARLFFANLNVQKRAFFSVNISKWIN